MRGAADTSGCSALSIHSRMLSVEDLAAVTGYDRWGDITRSLNEQGIKYFIGKGGRPWTTIDLVNAAGGLDQNGGMQPLFYSPDSI